MGGWVCVVDFFSKKNEFMTVYYIKSYQTIGVEFMDEYEISRNYVDQSKLVESKEVIQIKKRFDRCRFEKNVNR